MKAIVRKEFTAQAADYHRGYRDTVEVTVPQGAIIECVDYTVYEGVQEVEFEYGYLSFTMNICDVMLSTHTHLPALDMIMLKGLGKKKWVVSGPHTNNKDELHVYTCSTRREARNLKKSIEGETNSNKVKVIDLR